MGFFASLFGGEKKNEYDGKPAIYGGDGLSESTPAIVNCASVGMAKSIIQDHVSGNLGEGWSMDSEYLLNVPSLPGRSIKMVSVITPSGQKMNFDYDISRSFRVASKMYGN